MRRGPGVGVALCTALALLPLWLFKYVPSTDLPQHIALSAVGFRLLQGDPLTQSVYAFNLQPIPYHLVYTILIPAVGLFGPLAGAKVVLSLTAFAIVGAMLLLCRALGRSPWLAVGGIFMFYSVLFFWGFVTTLVGIPWVLLCAWALLRHADTGTRRHALLAAFFAAAACCAHVILVPACCAAAAAYWVMAPGRHAPVACSTVGASLLPCIPWFISIMQSPATAPTQLAWESPLQAWEHFRLFFGTFDHGMGRNAHHAVIVLLVCVAFAGRHLPIMRACPSRAGRFLWVFGGLNALLFLAVPLVYESEHNYVWLVNLRYLIFTEAALFLACKGLPPSRLRQLWRPALVACLMFFLVGLGRFWSAYDRDMRSFDGVLERVPENATLAVRNGYEHYARAWPFVTINMHAYALARGLRHESRMFENGHLPVRTIADPVDASARPSGRGAFDNPLSQHPVTMAPYDFALIEAGPELRGTIPAPEDGELIYAAGRWELYRRVDARIPGATAPSAQVFD